MVVTLPIVPVEAVLALTTEADKATPSIVNVLDGTPALPIVLSVNNASTLKLVYHGTEGSSLSVRSTSVISVIAVVVGCGNT